MLETALRQSYDWQRIGVQVPIAVNISLRNLRDPGLSDRIRGQCSTWGVRHDALEMEITESAMMVGASEMLSRLQRLCEQHIRLYIGTGYSSLSHLKAPAGGRGEDGQALRLRSAGQQGLGTDRALHD